MRLSRQLLWTTSAATLLSLTAACGDDPSEPTCGEPLYGGDATDEAWRALVDAEARATPNADVARLTTPESGASYDASAAPPRWAWSSTLASASPSPAPSSAFDTARSMLARVGEWILPTAHAHLPPFTGDIYWVRVSIPGRTCPVEMLTSNLDWQLDAATWDTLKASAGQELSVQVISAYLLQNRITEGPYRLPQPVTVRVQKGTP
ncbi:hypothetical protein NVS55_37615 [Myxococcus stipitatus]|uniref:hypothetical protein n=1 Tax=Myxococcus stipitatus TaxID=83455 RepID=UPI003144F152